VGRTAVVVSVEELDRRAEAIAIVGVVSVVDCIARHGDEADRGIHEVVTLVEVPRPALATAGGVLGLGDGEISLDRSEVDVDARLCTKRTRQ